MYIYIYIYILLLYAYRCPRAIMLHCDICPLVMCVRYSFSFSGDRRLTDPCVWEERFKERAEQIEARIRNVLIDFETAAATEAASVAAATEASAGIPASALPRPASPAQDSDPMAQPPLGAVEPHGQEHSLDAVESHGQPA